ncbi:MAG: hypothetical protein ACKVVP_16405 [Chloroflexota bacterium]
MVMTLPRVHAHVPEMHYEDEGLLGIRHVADYNSHEQRYSALLYRRIEQLLKGERNDLLLLRKYPGADDRIGIMSTPAEIDRDALRIDIMERLATDALVFLSERSVGGPVAQDTLADGARVETRKYPTRYPHIIIERVDLYQPDADEPESIQWLARRVQNQHTMAIMGRVFDVANLGIDVARFFIR